MAIKRQYLPSLGAFATFEVAAKRLSFTLAGQELNVTQAAVSQQVRSLERSLGVTLFRRRHNGLDLTREGQQLLVAVSQGLDGLCAAIDGFAVPQEDMVITCAGTAAAMKHWLPPYVTRFTALHPGIRFVLLASDENSRLHEYDAVDIALLCGNERCDAGERLHFLCSEIVEPVCTPEFLALHGPFDAPSDLARAALLELHPLHWSSEAIGWYPVNWEFWFREQGLAPPDTAHVMVSNSYPLLIDAALEGRGVGLGWHHIVRALVAEGRLCRIFDAPVRVDRGNYLKVNAAAADRPLVREFVDFILTDMATAGDDLLARQGLV